MHFLTNVDENSVSVVLAYIVYNHSGLPPPSDDEENVDEEPEMTVTSSDESVGDQSDVDDDEPIYITKIRKSAKQALNSGEYKL